MATNGMTSVIHLKVNAESRPPASRLAALSLLEKDGCGKLPYWHRKAGILPLHRLLAELAS